MCSTLEAETQLLSSSLFQFDTIWDKNASTLTEQDYIEKINEVQAYLEKVKNIVGPGCSKQVLNVAVKSMSSLVLALSDIFSTQKLHSSL